MLRTLTVRARCRRADALPFGTRVPVQPRPSADSEPLSSAELNAVLTSRLSAARGGPGDAPGPASDRELFRRMPGSALGSIVETEIDEITRRTDDLLFPIDGGGGPLGRIRGAIKRTVRRLGLHYLIRQTEMNKRLARSVAAIQSYLDHGLAALERADHRQLARCEALEARLLEAAAASERVATDADARHAALVARSEESARAVDEGRRQSAAVLERLDVGERRLAEDLAKRDAWLLSLEGQLRAVLEDVRAQIRERDGWIESTRRTVDEALAELHSFASGRDEWLRSLEARLLEHRGDVERQSTDRDQWLARLESSVGELRRETELGLESRDQWLRALEGSIRAVGLRAPGATHALGAETDVPEDTWIVAARTAATPAVESLGAPPRSATPAAPDPSTSQLETTRALLTDVAELRPRSKVAAELEPLRERLAGRRKVVDVGCGEGHALAFLRDLGVTAEGVDLDARAVATCRAEGFAAVHADAIDYLGSDRARGEVDAIVCLHLIEHLDVNPALELLIAFAKALPPGGLLVLATPNPESASTQLVHFWRDLGHVRPYPRITLERILTKLGFAVEAAPSAG